MGITGDHFVGVITAQKVLQVGLWWRTIFGDAHQFVQSCDVCQRWGSFIAVSFFS